MADSFLVNSDQSIISRRSLHNGRRSLIKCIIEQKRCIFCSEYMDENEYEEHVATCVGTQNTTPDSIEEPTISETPLLTDYSENTAANEFVPLTSHSVIYEEPDDDDHKEHATNDVEVETILLKTIPLPTEPPEVDDQLKDDSATHFQVIKNIDDVDEDTDDQYGTPRDTSPTITDEHLQKICVLCHNMINESEFIDHIMYCSDLSLTDDEPQIYELESIISTDNHVSSKPHYDLRLDIVKDCIICFKPIKESEYVQHVHACLSEPTTSETMQRQGTTCFSCHRTVDLEDNLSRETSCPSRHIYCLTCLQNSMENFARTRSIPLCHPRLCDYALSRYDIAFFPLERRISDRLLQLVQGQQRPQCSRCHFYIDINEIEEFYNHIDVCQGNLIPCLYCLCPYSIDQVDNHSVQCRNDKSSRIDKLIDFLMAKTKYSFTKDQINFFVRERKKRTYDDINILEIVDALAVFGPTFPYDLPTKECDVCMEACSYEDIYVFDCTENHKLCYTCYYKSCETKMSNGEILTCGICTNPLRDSELNQLRISKDEIQKLRDYQMKKTLDDYSNHTRGILKCPNQNCSWIAEADDPTQRFKVQCRLCKQEFCSLCNQQYHYRTTCQQLPQITQQWYLWCEKERARYLTTRARKDAAYVAKLDNYNRQLKENEDRNQDLRRRYEELVRDEQYKAKHCRLCPSCQRVVQRLEGCDKMICGQDAHGGNVQSGCGTKFNWPQAQPYTATAAFQAQQSTIDLPKPETPIVQHIGVRCDQCRNNVTGIRFDCVHCPTLTYCEKCEQQATLDHAKENQQMKQQSHVFRLIMTPEEVSSL